MNCLQKKIAHSSNKEITMAAAKKTAMGQSAKSHQKDLAKISGMTAAKKKGVELKKAKQKLGILDATGAAMTKAEKRTLKSFKKSK